MPRGRHRQVSALTRISVYTAITVPVLVAVVLVAVSGSTTVLRAAVLCATASAVAALGVVLRTRRRHQDRLEEEMDRRRDDRDRLRLAREDTRAVVEDLRLRLEQQSTELARMRATRIREVAARRPQPLTPALFARAAASLQTLERRAQERGSAAAAAAADAVAAAGTATPGADTAAATVYESVLSAGSRAVDTATGREAGVSAAESVHDVAEASAPQVRRPPISAPDLVPAYAASVFGPAGRPLAGDARPVSRVARRQSNADQAGTTTVAPGAVRAEEPAPSRAESEPQAAGRGLVGCPPDADAVVRMVQDRVAALGERAAADGSHAFDFFTPTGTVTAEPAGAECVDLDADLDPGPSGVPTAPSGTAGDDLADDLGDLAVQAATTGGGTVSARGVLPDPLEDALGVGGPSEPEVVHAGEDPAGNASADVRAHAVAEHAGSVDAAGDAGVAGRGGEAVRPEEDTAGHSARSRSYHPMPVDLTAHDDTEEMPRVQEGRRRA